MAIARYSPTTTITKTVQHSNGTFTVDCSTGTNFYLNFNNSDYINPTTWDTPVYVGGKTASTVGVTSSWTTSLTDLTGGIASQPSAGDVVVVSYAVGSIADINLSITGYTELVDLYSDDTVDTNLGVYYKVMTSTPDTLITLSQTGSADNAGAVAIHVWRNIDTSNPIDVTTTTATNNNSALADPPAITTSTQNAVVIAIGASGNDNATTPFTQGGDLSNFLSIGGSDTEDATVGMGSIATTTPATVNPLAFSTSSTTNFSWAAATVALRPKTAFVRKTAATILFTNIPDLRNDITVSTSLLPSMPETVSLTWDSAIIKPLDTVSFLTSISPGDSLSYGLYSQNGLLFLEKNNLSTSENAIEKEDIIRSTQTWTAPADVNSIEVLLCGGGGSGDATNVSTPVGGLGSVIKSYLTVTPNTTYTVTIGAGGAAPATGTDGLSGSASSFGALLSIDGATGGTNASKLPAGVAGIEQQQATFIGYDPIYGLAGIKSSDARKPGAPNTGQGGSPGRAGGSGVCIIRYRSAL